MSTMDFSLTRTALWDEQERGVPHDAPLLLPLIEQAADELQVRRCLLEVVSQLTQRAAQRLPITAASPLCRTSQASEERPFADQVFTTVSVCLHQGFRRLLLVPWGGRQEMGPLVETALLALSTMTGEAVSQAELALPHVHVEGVSARRALGGLSSIQTQLSPLLEAFPGRSQPLYFHASALFMKGHAEEAAAEVRQIVSRNPRHARAQILLGAACATLGQRDCAQAAFQASLDADARDPSTYVNLGLFRLQIGDPHGAVRYFAEALTLDPASTTARNGLAQAKSAAGLP